MKLTAESREAVVLVAVRRGLGIDGDVQAVVTRSHGRVVESRWEMRPGALVRRRLTVRYRTDAELRAILGSVERLAGVAVEAVETAGGPA